MAASVLAQVPAAIGLPPDAAWALQAASAQLPGASAESGARRAAAAVLGASLRTAYAAAGLHGPFAQWRRCRPSPATPHALARSSMYGTTPSPGSCEMRGRGSVPPGADSVCYNATYKHSTASDPQRVVHAAPYGACMGCSLFMCGVITTAAAPPQSST